MTEKTTTPDDIRQEEVLALKRKLLMTQALTKDLANWITRNHKAPNISSDFAILPGTSESKPGGSDREGNS